MWIADCISFPYILRSHMWKLWISGWLGYSLFLLVESSVQQRERDEQTTKKARNAKRRRIGKNLCQQQAKQKRKRRERTHIIIPQNIHIIYSFHSTIHFFPISILHAFSFLYCYYFITLLFTSSHKFLQNMNGYIHLLNLVMSIIKKKIQ